MRDLIGRTLGHYRFVEKVGAGGMGEVYRARDERLDRDVAIKVLPEVVANDADRLHRFQREAKAVAALSHPNILEIHDFDSEDGLAYAVTELLEGESLQEYLLKFGGPMPWEQALDIASEVSKGLGAAHGKGVVHRDIKPPNIFMCADGRVKILDFGLAATRGVVNSEAETGSLEAPLTHKGAVMGTAGYMAPEQVRGEPADQRSDIFALGCVLYEMLGGQRAFKRETTAEIMTAILREEPRPLRELAGDIPVELERIVVRALAKDRTDRYETVGQLEQELEAFRARRDEIDRPVRATQILRLLRRPGVLAPLTVLLIALAIVGFRAAKNRSKISWVRSEAIPEIMRMVEDEAYFDAYQLAMRADELVPGDPVLSQLWPEFAVDRRTSVSPSGARFLIKPYPGHGKDWYEVGRFAGESIRMPRGAYISRIELDGHVPFDLLIPSLDQPPIGPIRLPPAGSIPPGMVVKPSLGRPQALTLSLWQYQHEFRFSLGDFLVDVHEVTNRAYKAFVDDGGYSRHEFWNHEFREDGRSLTWDEALSRFRDQTGRQGPATWEFGTYPDGMADYPVTGVSWYEAAAYAEYAGKRLPTIYHFAALDRAYYMGDQIIHGGNFGSGGLAPVGATPSAVIFGTWDMAGNAREWLFNATGDRRFTFGGAWNGPKYFYNEPDPRPPFDRDPSNGFRCVKAVTPESFPEELDQPLERIEVTDWRQVEPFSDEEFQTRLEFFDYSDRSLEPKVELTDDSALNWRLEKVTFNAGYGNERVVGYLFLPKSSKPPYQAVVFWPGAEAVWTTDSRDGKAFDVYTQMFGFVMKDGRALLIPVLYGTFERGGRTDFNFDQLFEELVDFEMMTRQVKDVRRSVDYLESREDIDSTKIAYAGFSWGAHVGPIACVAEPRLRTGVLVSGSLIFREEYKWALRTTTPMMMVAGRYDSYFPYEENTIPYFEALAAPAEHKRLITYETDHLLSGHRKELVRDTLEWLDTYLGPVTKR